MGLFVVARADPNGCADLVLVTPGDPGLLEHLDDGRPLFAGTLQRQLTARGSAMMSALSLLLSAGGEVGGGDSRVRN